MGYDDHIRDRERATRLLERGFARTEGPMRFRITVAVYGASGTYEGWPGLSTAIAVKTITQARKFERLLTTLFDLLHRDGIKATLDHLERIAQAPGAEPAPVDEPEEL